MVDAPKSEPTRARGRPKAWTDKTDQNTIKSLDRALDVLARLGDLEEATLSELASDLSQSPATVYRILTTFQSHGFTEFEAARQVWSVGAGAFLTGAKFLRRTSLVERARPHLRALMEQTGETANLGVAKDFERGYVVAVNYHRGGDDDDEHKDDAVSTTGKAFYGENSNESNSDDKIEEAGELDERLSDDELDEDDALTKMMNFAAKGMKYLFSSSSSSVLDEDDPLAPR